MSSAELEQMIIRAISAGEVDAITRALWERGVKVPEYRQADGATLLHLSAACGSAKTTEALLKLQIPVNAQTIPDHSTALHMASSSGRLSTVEALLEHPDIDDTIGNVEGQTPLDIAQSKQIETAIRYARSKYTEHVLTSLHQAVQAGSVDKITEIMTDKRAKALVDVNAIDPSSGETILHRAVKIGDTDVIKACLQIGTNPFAKNKKGKLPIEVTLDDKIKQLLKNAPMVESPELKVAEDCGTSEVLSGYLHKYVNFASGYRQRYVVLEDGVLSYFKSKDDYPVRGRGTLNMQYARLIASPNDNLSFELRSERFSLFFRAENDADATRWKLALAKCQKSSKSLDDLPSSHDNKSYHPSFASTGRIPTSLKQPSLPRSPKRPTTATTTTCSSDAADCEYQKVLSMAKECLDQLETCLSSANGRNVPLDSQSHSTAPPDPVAQQLLHSLQAALVSCGKRERYWQERYKIEHKSRIMMEESLRNTKFGISYESSGSLPEASEFNDEFYDALEEAEAMAALSLSTESDLIMGEEILSVVPPKDVPIETLKEARVVERAIPPKDLQFIQACLDGYNPIRRDQIPVESTLIPPISIWHIIKNAIGKDLTRIPIPVNFSEPISMLQRLAEDLEYADLLYLASTNDDSLMRLQYAAAFALSPYSSTDGRISKPFNPLLGETFEYVSHEHGFRYISEQVSHHPPISACHCESARYAYYAEVSVKTKFWGKSIELVPEGLNHIFLKETNEHISYRKVNTAVYNLIMGKMWIDHYGPLKVINHSNGERVELELKATGWRTSDPKKVEGFAYDKDGTARFALEGYWNKYLRTRNLETGQVIELWRRRPVPPWSEKMYNFTYLTMTLNEFLPPLAKLVCPTDSRFRPDQRAMEDGGFDDANMIKVLLEEKQRATRREWEADPSFSYEPCWFTKATDEDSGESYWKYTGGYWEARQTGDWSQARNIYLKDTESTSSSSSLSKKSPSLTEKTKSSSINQLSTPDLSKSNSELLSCTASSTNVSISSSDEAGKSSNK